MINNISPFYLNHSAKSVGNVKIGNKNQQSNSVSFSAKVNELDINELAKRAKAISGFWIKKLGGNANSTQGMAAALTGSIPKMHDLSPEELSKLDDSLRTTVIKSYRESPPRFEEDQCAKIKVDYDPNPLLTKAIKGAGIDLRRVSKSLPFKTSTWIEGDGNVWVVDGEHQPPKIMDLKV